MILQKFWKHNEIFKITNNIVMGIYTNWEISSKKCVL